MSEERDPHEEGEEEEEEDYDDCHTPRFEPANPLPPAPPVPLTWAQLKELGNDAHKAGKYSEAIKKYTEAMEATGGENEASLFGNRAASHMMLWHYREAIADCKKAISMDATNVKIYIRMAKCMVLSGDLETPLSVLASAPVTDDVRKEIKAIELCKSEYNRCKMLLEQNNPGSAERATATLLTHYPESTPFMMLRCECRLAIDPLEQVRVLGKLMARDESNIPPDLLVLRAKAQFYCGSSQVAGAMEHLKQALQLDPDFKPAQVMLKKIRSIEDYRQKGNAAFKEKRYPDALEQYNQALLNLEIGNKAYNVVLLCNRAAVWKELKNYQGAMEDCNKAIALDDNCARAYQRRSRVQQELGKWDEATRDMQRAAELDPAFESEMQELKGAAKAAKRKDYYKILACSRGDDDDTLKRSYKKLALQWHPDRWAHGTEDEKRHAEHMFKEVQEAHTVLTDPKKRRLYDNGMLDNNVEGDGASGNPFGGGGFSNDDIMNMFMGGGGFPGGFHQGGGGRRGRGGPSFSFSF
eukprot:PhF_6_TR31179/c0_g1_i1/m.45712/K09527/DNAJC7; DnaJ homolog subfamily C member 7